MTLRELLADEAMAMSGVMATIGPDRSITWTRNDRPFAAASADGSTAEFALEPAVAAAATRTPDVTPSSRGPGWVTFSPPDVDDHAADRALAWLASAHRRLELRN